jgi:hypothetical protein
MDLELCIMTDPDPTRLDLSAANNWKSRSQRNIQKNKRKEEEERNSTFTVFYIIVSPFNGYIARLFGKFSTTV